MSWADSPVGTDPEDANGLEAYLADLRARYSADPAEIEERRDAEVETQEVEAREPGRASGSGEAVGGE
eukprot:1059258-Heterocapsa_arctica.AAC.1